MPAQQNETLNGVEVVEFALDIFNEELKSSLKVNLLKLLKIDRTQSGIITTY
jgi:hypothetical protein